MAYADNTTGGRSILEAAFPVKVVLSGTVKPGDLLGDSAGTWVVADGNADIYGELVAGGAGVSGDTITAYRYAVVGGVTGGTKGAAVYLSDTAGQYSDTAGTVEQVVGVMATATEMVVSPSLFKSNVLKDSQKLVFGTSGDVTLKWDGTNLLFEALADDALIEVGDSAVTQKSFDLKWYGDSASGADLMEFDASANRLSLDGIDFRLKDSDILEFGDAADVAITWDGTNLVITPATDDTGSIRFGNGTLDMDVRFVLGAAADYVEFNVGDKNLAFVGLAKIDIGTTGTPLVLTEGTPIFDLYSTCASTSGSTSAEPFFVSSTMTGAGAVGGRARFYMTTNVALAGWSNALKAHMVYGAAGQTTGLGSAFVGEIELSAGTTAGTYAALEAEVVIPSGASLGTATSFLYCNISGADIATFDTNGFLFEIGSGISVGSGKFFQTNTAAAATHALKCRIDGATYYVMLTDTGA